MKRIVLLFALLLAMAASPVAAQITSIEAKKVMRQPVLSVMDKPAAGPSGDKHDYISYAPYWWPDPSKPDGLPYIRKDGHTNREIVAKGDANAFSNMATSVRKLTEAYAAHGDEAFAANAVRRISVWFLNPETRMNPHLNYGQIVMGRNEGRGAGMVTMRHLIDVLDSIAVLRSKGTWPPAEDKAMREWLTAWYALRIEAYLGMRKQGEKRAEELKKRIAWQIEPDGQQPLEAAREDGFSYSVFNLEALAHAAVSAKQFGVNLWKFQTKDKRSMQAAFQYLTPYASGAKPWTGKQLKAIPKDALAEVRRLYDLASE